MKKACYITGICGVLFYFIASLFSGYILYQTITLHNSPSALAPESALPLSYVILMAGVGISLIALPVFQGLELFSVRKAGAPSNMASLVFFSWALFELVLYPTVMDSQVSIVPQYILLNRFGLDGSVFFSRYPPWRILWLLGTALLVASSVLAILFHRRESKREESGKQAS